jgi:hypothetical protein
MPNPEAAALAKLFEPILLFHPDEKFFPVDPKLYLERSALWRSKPHISDVSPSAAATEKANWGEPPAGFPRKPQLAKGEIAALEREVTGGKTWLGEQASSGQSPFLVIPEPPTERPLGEDRFLQLTGWEPYVDAPNEVTSSSLNRHPTISPNLYNGALVGGKPWYYVEYLTNQELLSQFGLQTPSGLDLFRAVINNERLSQPRLLVFHFLYALHDEPLRGCEEAGEGKLFGTFAGEWSSVSILINSAQEPTFIGITSRNVGDPKSILGEENRIGMTVRPWKAVDAIGGHPKIFVSNGTHGNYLTPGPKSLAPFTPGDIDLNMGTCAQIETLDDVIPGGEEVDTPGKPPAISFTVVWGALAVNVLLGLLFAMIDLFDGGSFGSFIPAIDPNRAPQDETGGGAAGFGLILRPAGLFVPEQAAAQRTEDWATKTPDVNDNPSYDFIVDRDAQVWWPPRGSSPGYAGRWGPSVTNDPKSRRSGMRCPPFALMMLEGVARQ